ncbi:hypothetical protein K505DRAFT_351462 [Melanomma pulvis-pyrius CBS 109.77]|uniref:5'-3' DNA helicase ZGRF1-like N-terminal domain-containing protein n=1 Tax=Melanomma pulvis-pyrius CBS 109.77 TaxID=1314802 RepID=A0A6A6X4Z6_9PLEO|nr:hypothetical protein K505DRAFT_351462 [Melanomma pulvis-pyrius CBS 109.77]
MAAPMHGTPRPSALPASQNTALVAKFRCLFTRDLRQKQKRWQDGFLQFHFFNKRVMVYDTARNAIGDAYWKDSHPLQEGDELQTNNNIIVQVEDPMGVTQTDLTPLLERKTKDSPQGKSAPRPLPRPAAPASNVPRIGFQLRHKSLNALLGTPRGPIGKSISMQSPYEARMEKENEWAAERAAKRQKTTHTPIDLTSSSPTKAGRSTVDKVLPLWARTTKAKKATAPPTPVPHPVAAVSLESDVDHMSSGITLPSTPPATEKSRPPPNVTSVPTPIPNPTVPTNARAQITPKLPRAKIRLPQSKPPETPRPPSQPSSPPVSVSNRLSNSVQKPTKQPTKQPSPPESPPREPKAKILRLSTGSKPASSKKPRVRAPSPQSSSDAFEDMEVIQGFLDAQLIIPPSLASPPKSAKVTKSKSSPAPKVRKTKPTSAKKGAAKHTTPDETSSLVAPALKVTKPKLAGKRKVLEKQSSRDISPPLLQAVLPQPPKQPSLELQCNLAASPPKVALSTGGFRMKPKTKRAQGTSTTTIAPSISLPTPRPISVPLPPHPLRANKAGALMSTTELSALLQKPPKTTSLDDDPIEDCSQLSAVSPNRSFRRVRSENDTDAPIPSTSEIWERRNLPTADNPTIQPPGVPATTTTTIEPVAANPKPKPSGLAALVRKTDPRKRFQRTLSLNVDTQVGGMGVGAGIAEGTGSPSPVEKVDADLGPWSTEAFDLFDWRPPGIAREGEVEDRGIGMLVDG